MMLSIAEISSSGLILAGKTEVTGEKLEPVPLCPVQISHGFS